MSRTQLFSTLCLVGIALLVGCGPRTAVIQDNIQKKIDGMIGELDIQYKEVEQGIEKMKKAKSELTRGKIKLDVLVERADAEAATIEGNIADAKSALGKVQQHLVAADESKEPVSIAGKEYDKAALNTMAQKVIKAYQDLEKKLVAQQTIRGTLATRRDQIAAMLATYDTKIEALESSKSQIDTNMTALKTLREASSIGGAADQTFGENFKELENKVADLSANLETELRFEDAQWNEATATTGAEAVETFIEATKTESDTIAEIDKILGT